MTPDTAAGATPYLTAAGLVVYAQRWMKTQDAYREFIVAFPGADKWAHRAVAAVGALAAAIGIHWTYTGAWETGWQIHLAIPAGWTLLHGLTDFTKVFVLQQLAYDATRQPPWVSVDTSGVKSPSVVLTDDIGARRARVSPLSQANPFPPTKAAVDDQPPAA